MKHDSTTPYLNAFNCIAGIGPQKLFLLSRHFDSFADAWHADEKTLITAGISPTLAQKIVRARAQIDITHEWKKCTRENITLISTLDDHFPDKLRDIPQPPFCLYVRGNTDALHMPSVAIVGSRKTSEYGTHATTTLANTIAQNGIAITSGLALGTDAVAHRGALDAGGTTIAVLAGGIDDASITPRTHYGLAHDIIAQGGLLVSEYPVGTQPNRGTFPVRNRLMAGLSDAVIIIEAAKKSGTLITAQYATTYNKPLFALPGSIFAENALGPNTLIQKGVARPILAGSDILALFDKKTDTHAQTPTFTDTDHEALYTIITNHPDGIHINDIIKKSPLDTQHISSILTLLEVSGHITNIGNQKYVVNIDCSG